MAKLFNRYVHAYLDDADILTGCQVQSCEMLQITEELGDEFVLNCFANVGRSSNEEDIYPVTVNEIATEQRRDRLLKPYFKRKKSGTHDRYMLRVIDDTEVLLYDNKRLVIPARLQSRIVQWYHHYLMHPGHTRLEETIAVSMYWRSLRTDVRRHVKKCDSCQRGKKRKVLYRHLPPKTAEVKPWNSVCVDLIGPYTLKGKDGTVMDFMCLTMIDPATAWFEIIELPLASVNCKHEGDKITEVVIDKSSAQISCLFNKQWLSRYPRAKYIVYDNGSKFKLHFADLCESYQIKRKPTSVKNPQANSILERIYGVLTNMMRTAKLDMADTVTSESVDEFLTNAAWALCSTYHTVLQSLPGTAIFGRDMLFDIPYVAD